MTGRSQDARAFPRSSTDRKQAPDIPCNTVQDQSARSGRLIAGCWSRTFPGLPDQVRHARRFTGDLLDGFPGADDATVCVSELAANAILHSRSAGSTFTVRLALGRAIYCEIDDQGGPWITRPDPGGLRGRGLMIVEELTRARAGSYGIAGDEAGRIAWFVMNGATR